MRDVRRESEPFDRLTELCNEMSHVLEREENADVQAIIMLNDGVNGGIESFGMTDDQEMTAAIIIHLKAIFAASGKRLTILTDDRIYTP
jgi:hypothetical protein